MTQKELLYVEDACKHEEILIELLEENKDILEDEKLLKVLDKEITIHQRMLDNLFSLLEDKKDE